MNNGSLLNSLLGATSMNPVSGKNASNTFTKSRVDTGEQFRNALDQARPEIAANKPGTPRKQTQAARKQETRQAVEHVDRRNATADINKQEKSSSANNRAPEKIAHESRQTTDKTSSKLAAASKHTGDEKDAGEIAGTTMDKSVLIGDDEDVVISGELSLSLDNALALEGSDSGEHDDTADEVLSPELVVLEPLGGVSKPDEENAPAILAPVLSNGLLPESDEVTSDGEETLVLTTSAPTVGLANVSVITNTGSTGVMAANTTTNAIIPVTESIAPTLEQAQADIAPDMEAQENPDLFILSGKAAFGKLMDANLTSDKTTPVIDAAKPALTVASLTEPLLRMTEAQSPAARSFVVQTGLPVAVGQPQWSQAVGEKVLWLAAQNVSAAEIRLDPPDLGPMQVKVTVNQDQATVAFTSPHPIVRDALDQQLNRLREMFAEQGLNLVNVDVSDKSFAQQQQGEQQDGKSNSAQETEEDLLPVATTIITSSRLVDHYA